MNPLPKFSSLFDYTEGKATFFYADLWAVIAKAPHVRTIIDSGHDLIIVIR